jgi:Histidine phosphatase superfamily (branch 1)
LTERGRAQAKGLGESWANVRIDALYTSPYKRAKETAQILAEQNHSHPEPIESAGLVEHDLGPVVRQLRVENRLEESYRERAGKPRPGLPERDYRPRGGESLQDLVHRGISELRDIVLKHVVALPVPPKEMDSDYSPRGTGDELVENVPHVVIAGHNNFLAELREALLSWNKYRHVDANVDYPHAEWYVCNFSFVVSAQHLLNDARSRHILKFQGYGTNRPKVGYYAKDYPFEMQAKDLRRQTRYMPDTDICFGWT